MTFLATASFLAFGTLLVLFGTNATPIMASLQIDYAEFGLLGSMLSLGLGVGIVIAGPVTDRFPRRPLYIASCIVVVLATTTLGPDTTYHRLVIHMLAIGFGAGFYETILNTIVIEGFPETAGRRLLFIQCGATFAACTVPILIDVVRESQALPWHETFRFAGYCHLPLIAAACFIPIEYPHPAQSPQSSTTPTTEKASTSTSPANDRLILGAICVATFAYVGVESALTIFVVDHAATDLGLTATRAARTMSAFWGGLLVGRLASGLAPRSPSAGAIAVLSTAAAGIILLFEYGLFGSLEVAMIAVGLALGSVFPVMIGFAGRALPNSPATAVGLAGGLGSMGGFLIPWITGRAAADISLPFAITTLAGWLLLLAAASAWVQFRRQT